MRTPPDYHNPLATAKRPAVRFLPRTARFLPRTARSETWNRHINGTHSPKGRCSTRKALFHAALATLAWGFRDETGGSQTSAAKSHGRRANSPHPPSKFNDSSSRISIAHERAVAIQGFASGLPPTTYVVQPPAKASSIPSGKLRGRSEISPAATNEAPAA